MIKLLIGGSPCTHWSIAQSKNRETEPSGQGWELFRNFLIARDKYNPDFILYENNKSMSTAIRERISMEFGHTPTLINSALVSAQNRQRLYWVGQRTHDGLYSRVDVEQPEDRGILLRDILESGVAYSKKGYTLKASTGGANFANDYTKSRRTHIAEPIGIGYRNRREGDGKLYRRFETHGEPKSNALTTVQTDTMVAEPINTTPNGKARTLKGQYHKSGTANFFNEYAGKYSATAVAEPIRIGTIESGTKTTHDSKPFRVYSPDAKSVTLQGEAGGYGAKTGLYAVPSADRAVVTGRDGKTYPVYEVKDGQITIKGKQYPIKLADGYYIIRKLTVTECKRLQTVPDDYVFPVSDSQSYKMLGNGWTVDVIAHIMRHFDGITTEPVEVLSMYDGMSCGHIALDKLGANVVRYYATEIDRYAIQTTQCNYPGTVQLGNAFHVRDYDWYLGGDHGNI